MEFMPVASDKENFRLNITVSRHIYRKLKYWGKIHGKAPTTFAGQIVSSRVEANFDVIQKIMEDIAAYEGISLEELERRWDNEKNEE